jgi:hypothetical protein
MRLFRPESAVVLGVELHGSALQRGCEPCGRGGGEATGDRYIESRGRIRPTDRRRWVGRSGGHGGNRRGEGGQREGGRREDCRVGWRGRDRIVKLLLAVVHHRSGYPVDKQAMEESAPRIGQPLLMHGPCIGFAPALLSWNSLIVVGPPTGSTHMPTATRPRRPMRSWTLRGLPNGRRCLSATYKVVRLRCGKRLRRPRAPTT